ncbi:aldo/keto reductase [Sphingomonas sp. CGMCC 1.13654]|uniref:Aldo/keto reductase n=1 Tax=Sphingomonas chungangi TaxID=2683589 RepID=A0A838L813_9SPHN|nr:aldo/keto reductase [Sphingomonas chungangi]MBA2934835.1 aldo/keto reductase [Sphingomonas chungangi]MVW58146.1 aldo/keto reductase [Sphingomonas chungangi]
MKYRQLGRSGLTVSVVGLGCNNFGGSSTAIAGANAAYGLMDLEQTRAVVDAAFDEGINFFDTADLYGNGGSETFLGQILKDRRHDVVLATKWGAGMDARHDIAWGSRRYIRQACEASLRRLDTDYIDLYQMHWPDGRTPIEETIAALDELVQEGKVRYLGHSHFAPWLMADAQWIAKTEGHERFISAQDHYSLLARGAEAELIPACDRFGVGLLPYFPLANGLLTGKYRRGRPMPENTRMAGKPIDDRLYDLIEALIGYAEERGRTLVDIAVGALLTKDAVSSVITGATKAAQIRSNAAAASWLPDAKDINVLNELLKAHESAVSH